MLMKSLQSKLPLMFLFVMACGSSSSTKADGGGDAAVMGAFMAVQPCALEADYATGATVSFPNGDQSYSPKCLKVAAGGTVTFMATEGNFSTHPLEASRRRGNTSANPITTTQTSSTSREFTFAAAGFYAYYCSFHGASDDGSAMAGVIWVQ